MKSKICSKCQETKSITEFERRSDSIDGYRQYCRQCKAVQAKKAYAKWVERNKPQYWNMRARSLNSFGSRRKGKAGEIIKKSKPLLGEDLKQLYESNPFCFYCRIPLSKESVVFDHKIPLSQMGNHHISNIAVTCIDCNQLKSSRTDDEFKLFLSEYISRFSANTEVIIGTKKPVTP